MAESIKPQKRLQVLFDKKCPVRVLLAGCGGTGGFVAWNIARMMYHAQAAGWQMEAVFIDPDRVEEKNVGRQNFCPAECARYKSLTLADRYNRAYGIDIQTLAGPFDKYQMTPWQGITVVVGAVDTTQARCAIEKGVRGAQGHAGVIWWIDCGNEHSYGQVLAGNVKRFDMRRFVEQEKLGLCSQVPLPSVQCPELLRSRKKKVLPCAEAAAREEQSLMINQAMAAYASQLLYKIAVLRSLDVMAVYVSLDSCAARVESITAENVLKHAQERTGGDPDDNQCGSCGTR